MPLSVRSVGVRQTPTHIKVNAAQCGNCPKPGEQDAWGCSSMEVISCYWIFLERQGLEIQWGIVTALTRSSKNSQITHSIRETKGSRRRFPGACGRGGEETERTLHGRGGIEPASFRRRASHPVSASPRTKEACREIMQIIVGGKVKQGEKVKKWALRPETIFGEIFLLG